ncbi:periplasmic heavy metal sensor [Paracoccaceae bacterium Fryx2]|nr:periplasmic heavy metal sensor [Paracoccaceae bacterium Fryx2]
MTDIPPLAETPVPPPGRWLRVALAVSLAVNLGVAGVVAGAFLKGGPGGHRPASERDPGFGPFTAALSAEDRDALRRAYVERAPGLRAARAEMRTEWAAVLAALRREPFDPAALQAALDRQNARSLQRLTLGQGLLAAHLLAMTPDARRQFADRLQASLDRRPDRKPDDRGKAPGP